MTERPGRSVALVLLLWLGIALAVSFSGVLSALRPPAPQVMIVVLTMTSLAAALWVPQFRAWAAQASVRAIVAVHLTRFVGFYFLLLSNRGLLSPAFAIPAGWGDIAVSTFGLFLLLTTSPYTPTGRRLYLAWNVLGLIDILLVVANAARVGLADPASMKPLLHLPLSLLPTFLVPVIITSHILVFRRLKGLAQPTRAS